MTGSHQKISSAQQPRISWQAWLTLKLARWLAPDFSSPQAIERAIENDRARGPARPSRQKLRKIRFSEEEFNGYTIFRAAPRVGAISPVRLLYLHGGAYVLDLQAVQWNLITGLIQRTGAEVIVPIYPLAPEFGWQEGLRCVQSLYLKLVEESGIGNVVLVGDSAGGGLALALAQTLRDCREIPPAALVLFSPWLDVGTVGVDQPTLERVDPALTIQFLRATGRLWAKGLPPDDPRISPLFGDHTGLPPTIVFSGTRDVLDSDALRLATRNPDIDHRHYRDMIHVWPGAPIPEAKRALDEAAEFIGRHTGV